MSEPVNPMVIDLSHWDPAQNYQQVKDDGIVGVIYKATQGTGYTDDTYVDQQRAAKAMGLKWGAYHFAEATDVDAQVDNFVSFAAPDPDELFCLDWEDYGSNTMSVDQAKEWISKVERALGRPGECVIYGGNTLRENIDGVDDFFGSRRLWHCQYGNNPDIQESWSSYWLWQFTDGIYGPSPHSIDGVGPCDINSFLGSKAELIAQWASGSMQPPEPAPRPPRPIIRPPKLVAVNITAPDGVAVRVTVNDLPFRRHRRNAD